MNVEAAFLNGDLYENIFKKLPEGFVSEAFLDHVCNLKNALYGLKQTPRQWFAKINIFFCNDMSFPSCCTIHAFT